MTKVPMGEVWDNFSFYVKDNRTGDQGWLSIQDFFSEFGLGIIKLNEEKGQENEQTNEI